ncbi:hypothetical protein [Enterobacter hormaechei]|uniref:hypothetical protein n=1 Tax=Enterobacter hormaechei TaxID=158836 RepID=UPI0022363391|nr:hypothetical protein [Enterobacter hormaechei]MCW4831047.1 hypothetical protein [Enterobacter hormaechei subsp. xiangfangensis]
MNKSEHCKEVYAYFGLAMFRAQCVEQSIIQLLIFLVFFKENATKISSIEKWELDFDNFDKTMSKKTMGHLLSALRDLGVLNEIIESTLSKALIKRNWLAHGYFADRAIEFLNERGRNQMIDELEGIIELFNLAEDLLQPISNKLALQYGLTNEKLEEIKNEIYPSEVDDI